MKLGDKVEFSISLTKTNMPFYDLEELTPEQKKDLEEDGYLVYRRWQERKHETKQGIICGKRKITTKVILEEVEDPYRGWHLFPSISKEETIYLVATGLNGFYRVKEQDLFKVVES